MSDISFDHTIAFTRPTTPTISVVRILRGVAQRFAEAGRERRKRMTLVTLLGYDDFRLDDLGINRQDILDALSKR